jgi:AcrR family transcriptional regulator
MKKNTQKSDKRQKILIAARTLFNRTHNIKRVSLEAIAEEAGVSPTTIYNNFGDRETLVYEVIKDLVKTNLERNRAFIHSELPFAQKLIGVISAKLDVAEKFNTEIIEKLVSQDKKITPFIDKILQEEIKPLWCEMVADGKKRGYIDTALDDEALLAYLDVLQAGFRARPEVLQGFQNNLDFVEQLTHLMFYGFLKKEIDLFQKEDK